MTNPISKALPKLTYRNLLKTIARQRTRAVLKPFEPKATKTIQVQHITIYDYTPTEITHHTPKRVQECLHFHSQPSTTWINLDAIEKEEMDKLATTFHIHWLIQEDILSYGQRPKVDEIEGVMYALLNMLFVKEDTGLIEQEQISIVLGHNFIISFQEDAEKDVFDPVRKRLQIPNSRERERKADYLFYALIDIIVDSYLGVIEQLGNQIEIIEEQIITRSSNHTFEKISQLRKDIILLKRNITPVRDLVAAIIRSDSDLLEEKTSKYFKDVQDHVALANDLIDNYRDLILGLQDTYVNNINLRMNEVMKTLAIITSIMAPATVIGGIFGMNFSVIPYSHHKWGFYGTLLVMLAIPIIMIWWFRKRGWFQKDYPGQQNLF